MFYMIDGMQKEKRDKFKPYPWKKKPTFSQKRLDELNRLIYNDATLEEIYDASSVRKPKKICYNEEVAKKLMLEGEKFVRLDEPVQQFIVTSKGRLINTQTVKQLKVGITNYNIFWFANGAHINIGKVFEQIGWEFDVYDIAEEYIERGWRLNDRRNPDVLGLREKVKAKAKSIGIHPSMKKKIKGERQ